MFHLLTVHHWLYPNGIHEQRSRRSANVQRERDDENDRNSDKNNESGTGNAAAAPESPAESHRVLLAMRAFVIQFFGCRDCARHFEQGSCNMTQQVSTRLGSVLWLWTVHNIVNRRLAGSLTEDPSFPKIQFPSRGLHLSRCSSLFCRL